MNPENFKQDLSLFRSNPKFNEFLYEIYNFFEFDFSPIGPLSIKDCRQFEKIYQKEIANDEFFQNMCFCKTKQLYKKYYDIILDINEYGSFSCSVFDFNIDNRISDYFSKSMSERIDYRVKYAIANVMTSIYEELEINELSVLDPNVDLFDCMWDNEESCLFKLFQN